MLKVDNIIPVWKSVVLNKEMVFCASWVFVIELHNV